MESELYKVGDHNITPFARVISPQLPIYFSPCHSIFPWQAFCGQAMAGPMIVPAQFGG